MITENNTNGHQQQQQQQLAKKKPRNFYKKTKERTVREKTTYTIVKRDDTVIQNSDYTLQFKIVYWRCVMLISCLFLGLWFVRTEAFDQHYTILVFIVSQCVALYFILFV